MEDEITNSFNKERAYFIPEGSVGLDSMSSVDVFADRRLLSDIIKVDENMRIICNAGTVMMTRMSTFNGYGRVCYHPVTIANILSLHNVNNTFRVANYSQKDNCFSVHIFDGSSRVFSPTEKGLYVSKVLVARKNFKLMNTVEDNKKGYTRRDVKRAEAARRLLAIIGRPSE